MHSYTEDFNHNKMGAIPPPSTEIDLSDDEDTLKAHVVSMRQPLPRTFDWRTWFNVFKNIFPVYFAVHIAFFVITCYSVLFTLHDFAWQSMPIYTLWQSWYRWDTGHYTSIALHGYDQPFRTAFFPLYPLLERVLMVVTRNPFIAGLIISNVAWLVALMVLYRLVEEDFDQDRASRTVLYLCIFPTAFFLASGYNEALFLCLILLSFYSMRHGNWWVAGLFGLLASLTRSAGLFLLVPFCYEYLRQHQFKLTTIRLNVLSGALIATGTGVFALYCYFRFHDLLSFSHAQAEWNRSFHGPWHGIIGSFKAIYTSGGILNFQVLRNLTDLVPDLLFLTLIILSFIGPWKFPPRLWVYSIFASILYIFPQFLPNGGTGLFPLESMSRFMLEIFPGFIMLAAFGKYRTFNLTYLMVAGALLFFLLTQFLTGHWVL